MWPRSTGVPILALKPDQPIPASVVLSDRARLLIQDEMAAGNIVIVPEKPVDLDGVALTGWWSLDPVTGRLADLLETGRATSSVEYIVIVIKDYWARISFARLPLLHS